MIMTSSRYAALVLIAVLATSIATRVIRDVRAGYRHTKLDYAILVA